MPAYPTVLRQSVPTGRAAWIVRTIVWSANAWIASAHDFPWMAVWRHARCHMTSLQRLIWLQCYDVSPTTQPSPCMPRTLAPAAADKSFLFCRSSGSLDWVINQLNVAIITYCMRSLSLIYADSSTHLNAGKQMKEKHYQFCANFGAAEKVKPIITCNFQQFYTEMTMKICAKLRSRQ